MKILTSRWGEHTKDTHSCTLPLSCEGFRLWSGKRISIRDLRSHLVTGFIALCLSLSFVVDLWLITSDVSTAFMYAEVEEDACDLVLLPSNISFKGERVVCLLFKAMNGFEKSTTALVLSTATNSLCSWR